MGRGEESATGLGGKRPLGGVAKLPPVVVRELAAGTRFASYHPGEVVARIGERVDPGVVSEGMLRYSISSEDGRRATLRYIRAGEAFGVESLFQPMSHMVIAVAPTRVTHYDRKLAEDLAHRHPTFAMAIANELASSVTKVDEATATFAFMTVAQRVVHHLFALAAQPDGRSGTLARLSQQQLADAVGSVREVVGRVIRDLKAQNIVETSRSGINIANEADLYRFGRASSKIHYLPSERR